MYKMEYFDKENIERIYPYKEVRFEGFFTDKNNKKAYAQWYNYIDEDYALINFLQINYDKNTWEVLFIDAETMSAGDIVHAKSDNVIKNGKMVKEAQWSSVWIGQDKN